MLVINQKIEKPGVDLVCTPLNPIAQSKLTKSSQGSFVSDLIDLKRDRLEKDNRLKNLYFAIGMTVSLLLVIMAFEWRTYDTGEVMDLGTVVNDFSEIIEIPPTEQAPPPPPQKIIAPVIREVPDEEVIQEMELDIDIEVTEQTVIEEVIYEFSAEAPEEKVEEIYDIVESQPEPVGGFAAFYSYVGENLKYPSRASRLGISGRVFVQFVVEKDGSITDVKVIKGLYEDCDEEAVKVIQNSPKWIPGKQRGNAVRVYQRVPIVFLLNEN